MNYRQMQMYRAEWAKARAALESRNGSMTSAEADAYRRNLHADVGAPESSKNFNNQDFDRIMALIYALGQSDNLFAQLRIQDQPVIRARYLADDLLDRIEARLDILDRQAEADPIRRGTARESYLLYLLRRLNPKSDIPVMESADDKNWQQVIRLLVYRHDQVMRKNKADGHGPKPSKRVAKSRQSDTRRRRPYDTPAPVHTNDDPF
jgi:hypothetical protein